MNIVFLVHYFPPINSSGAKRVEALSKYLARTGHQVTVITTRKTTADGKFTEAYPAGVQVIELNSLGRHSTSVDDGSKHEVLYAAKPSFKRRLKNIVMNIFGQLPDPRLPFALSFASPLLDKSVRQALATADVVVGSCPPWPMLLAARLVRLRFGVPCVMDYRDQFSECHEMPGSAFAKFIEKIVDRRIASKAEALVTISDPMARYYASFRDDVTTILNGYDHEAMEAEIARAPWSARPGAPVVARYLGIVSPGRVPRNLLSALAQLHESGILTPQRLRFEYYGSAAVMEAVITDEYPQLAAFFSFHPAVPYRMSLALMANADYLLFAETSKQSSLSAAGILTTKLFEYLGSGRPVIADISAETLAGSVIRKAGDQHFVSNDKHAFLNLLKQPSFLEPGPSRGSEFATTLTRAHQAKQYAELLEQVMQLRIPVQ